MEVNDNNRPLIEKALNGISPNGATNMSAGILSSFSCIETNVPRKQGILLLTDGHVNVGERSSEKIINMCNKYFDANMNVTMTTIAYGTDHNAVLLRDLAVSGKSSYNLVTNLEDVSYVFGNILGSLLSVVCQNIVIDFNGAGSILTSQRMTSNADTHEIRIGDIHSDETVVVILANTVPRDYSIGWFDMLEESQKKNVVYSVEKRTPEWMEVATAQQIAAKIIESSANASRNYTAILEQIDEEITTLTRSIYSSNAVIQQLIEELNNVKQIISDRDANRISNNQAHVSMIQRSAVLDMGRGYSSPMGRHHTVGDPVAPQNQQMSAMSQLVRDLTGGGGL